MPVSEEMIAQRSYQIWESEGRPDGRQLHHWLRAKAELEAEDPSPNPQSRTNYGERGLCESLRSEHVKIAWHHFHGRLGD